jgi:oligopeptide/dipeptide ABC transporter ATP-binding protein
MEMVKKLLNVKHLKKYFDIRGKGMLHAVDDISFYIDEGETLGLVGESGCGKSTVGNVLVNLLTATDGEAFLDGQNILNLDKAKRRELASVMQIVFQDPYSSLNPKQSVRNILSEPFLIRKIAKGTELDKRLSALCQLTRIPEDLLNKFPHELDGGRRQTVGIARAFALNPKLIICDEPVSALDVSIQAQIINLLMDLQKERNLTYLFISHDLSVVKHISNRVIVMYLGVIVETAETEELFENPLHPYTKALLSAVPAIDNGNQTERIILEGDVPSPINPAPGCRFYKRCWMAEDRCAEKMPVLEDTGNRGHSVACHKASS